VIRVAGTTTCPECGQTARVYRHSFRDPFTRRYELAVSLHFVGSEQCRGTGRRVRPEAVTPGQVQ
jgi:hypothetical protein